MTFEEAKVMPKGRATGSTGEIRNVINKFLDSGYEAVVLKDWEDLYQTPKFLYMAVQRITKLEYSDKLSVACRQGKVFLRRA